MVGPEKGPVLRGRSHTLMLAHEQQRRADDVFEALVALILRRSRVLHEG
jgi:hypothetical protein